MTKILSASKWEADTGCYTVVASLGGGKSVYHVGHADGRWFTEDQANRLVDRINSVRVIDLAHWFEPRYERDEYAMIEAEYYEDGRG